MSYESTYLNLKQSVFEELGDVSLFQCDRKDYNVLDVSLRFRGPNQAENVHEKMSVTLVLGA